MTRRLTEDQLRERLSGVRRLLRDRHAGVEPDAQFAARVVLRLPRNEAWSFEWAVRRVLPASIAVALALMIAVVATGSSAGRTTSSSASASASAPGTSRTSSDPLEWLLEGRQELR